MEDDVLIETQEAMEQQTDELQELRAENLKLRFAAQEVLKEHGRSLLLGHRSLRLLEAALAPKKEITR